MTSNCQGPQTIETWAFRARREEARARRARGAAPDAEIRTRDKDGGKLWPWSSPHVPDSIDDYDSAVWFAVRGQADGELPRQDLETWVREQRASRSRDRLGPRPLTDGEHAQLLSDIASEWRRVAERPTLRQFTGRLPR